MHATSPDLRHWSKDKSFAIFAPTGQGYEPHDWRDPFVYFDERLGEHAMLLAARKTTGPKRSRGVTALLTSSDLIHWKVREPFWAPDEYFTHECPDLFRIGEWWYLVYSTFSERSVTHYRMARSLDGPWLTPTTVPVNDTFDDRMYYAAKTAGPDVAGSPRYAFGWLATRDSERDDGGRQWGGELVVHQINQQPDGSLAVRAPESVLQRFTRDVPFNPQPVLGQWSSDNDTHHARAIGRHSVLMLGDLPHTALLRTRVTFEQGSASMGVLLRADAALESYHVIRIEPGSQRIVADRWPRPGDQPFTLERPLSLSHGKPVELTLLIDGTCLVVYVSGQVALSMRMYHPRNGALGLFVTEGSARFEATRLLGLPR
jgi:beta-fructofuranosidase